MAPVGQGIVDSRDTLVTGVDPRLRRSAQATDLAGPRAPFNVRPHSFYARHL